MKTQINCFSSGNMCNTVRKDWNRLASIAYKLPVDPNPSEKAKAMKEELLEKINNTCHKCQRAQLIKLAKANLKEARNALLVASKSLIDVKAETEGVIAAVYQRLITENPELKVVFEIGDVVFECAIEDDIEWVEHCERVDYLEEEVSEATSEVNEAATILDALLNEK